MIILKLLLLRLHEMLEYIASSQRGRREWARFHFSKIQSQRAKTSISGGKWKESSKQQHSGFHITVKTFPQKIVITGLEVTKKLKILYNKNTWP